MNAFSIMLKAKLTTKNIIKISVSHANDFQMLPLPPPKSLAG
jgi:hypothetical protein